MKSDSIEISDEALVNASLSGDKKSLEKLIKRHQDYVYNLSLRLFVDPDDALDATQEVLIKLVTNLKSFRGESKFRTWMHRIAINHFLNTKQSKVEKLMLLEPGKYSNLPAVDDSGELSEEEIEEVRIMCSTAMLMCLNREQRLIYIIGEIFGADHQLGADLFEISPANFRVKLHRAKSDLLNHIKGRCGLIDPKNSCRCNKKAKQFAGQGLVDKEKLVFNTRFKEKVRDVVEQKRLETSEEIKKMNDLFADSPYQIREELDQLLSDLIK